MIARLLPVRTALAVTRSSPRITLNTGQIRGLTELHAGQPSAEALPLTEAPVPRLKYAVPRNTKGSLPVYTDYRAGHRKVEVQIRNIDGDARDLARDLQTTLFPADSADAQRLKIRILHSRHIVLSGGNVDWKREVVTWLQNRRF